MPKLPSNSEKFRALCEEADITQAKASEMIAQHTKRPCSVRSVRAWLTDQSKPSARPCPVWAVDALETALRRARKIS